MIVVAVVVVVIGRLRGRGSERMDMNEGRVIVLLFGLHEIDLDVLL